MKHATFFLVLISLIASGLLAACSDDAAADCPAGLEPFTEFNVYFGQERGDESAVSAAEWSDFLADVVTPQFPNGLTVFDAQGQWLDIEEERLYRERTKVLNVLVPVAMTSEAKRSLDEIAEIYVDRFDQQVVFKTSVPACAGF